MEVRFRCGTALTTCINNDISYIRLYMDNKTTVCVCVISGRPVWSRISASFPCTRASLFCHVTWYKCIMLNASSTSGTTLDAAVGIKSSRTQPSDYRHLLKSHCHFQNLFIFPVMISPCSVPITHLLPPHPFVPPLKHRCVCPAPLCGERPRVCRSRLSVLSGAAHK